MRAWHIIIGICSIGLALITLFDTPPNRIVIAIAFMDVAFRRFGWLSSSD